MALFIETAVYALTHDAIERVMISIHLEDQYRAQLSAAAKRIGSRTNDAVGEAVNRALVRDEIHESFYPPFVDGVLKAIWRDRTRKMGGYSRSEFAQEFPELLKALAGDTLDVGDVGDLCVAGSAVYLHTSWVARTEYELLEGAKAVLEEIKAKFDLFETPLVIRAHGRTEGDFMPDYDQTQAMTRYRVKILNMLQERKVIESWNPVQDRYGSPEGFVVETDEVSVRDTIFAIEKHLWRDNWKTSNPAAASVSSEVITPAGVRPIADSPFLAEVRKGMAAKIGEHMGTAVIVVLSALALLILGWLGLRKPVANLYRELRQQETAADTTKR